MRYICGSKIMMRKKKYEKAMNAIMENPFKDTKIESRYMLKMLSSVVNSDVKGCKTDEGVLRNVFSEARMVRSTTSVKYLGETKEKSTRVVEYGEYIYKMVYMKEMEDKGHVNVLQMVAKEVLVNIAVGEVMEGCFSGVIYLEEMDLVIIKMKKVECADGFDFAVSYPLRMSAKQVSLELCEAIIKLSEMGIAHNDIKLENFLVVDNDKVSLIDFGQSSLYYHMQDHRVRCTMEYAHPGHFDKQYNIQLHSPETDLYSLAVTIMMLLVDGDVPVTHKEREVYVSRELGEALRGKFGRVEDLVNFLQVVMNEDIQVDISTFKYFKSILKKLQ